MKISSSVTTLNLMLQVWTHEPLKALRIQKQRICLNAPNIEVLLWRGSCLDSGVNQPKAKIHKTLEFQDYWKSTIFCLNDSEWLGYLSPKSTQVIPI